MFLLLFNGYSKEKVTEVCSRALVMERATSHIVKGGEYTFFFGKGDKKDSDIPSILEKVESRLKKDKFLRFKIDLSENLISDEGVEKLLAWLTSSKYGQCVELRLHKNQIGDAGAKAIGQFLTCSKNSLEALHLSHNKIGPLGVMEILYGVANAKTDDVYVYPRVDYNGDHFTPLWLRLEKNETSNMESKLEEWRDHVIETRNYADIYQPICFPTKMCRPHRCERGKKVLAPLCHLKVNRTTQKISYDKKFAPSAKPVGPNEKFKPTTTAVSGSDSSSRGDSSENNASAAPTSTVKANVNDTSTRGGPDSTGSFAVTTANEAPVASPHTSPDGLDQSVYENMPFYILMDISALLEMVELRNRESVYPFSLPGLLALCNAGLIKHLKDDGSSTASKNDDAERIVLLLVKDVYTELNKMCTMRPFWKRKLDDAKAAFIKQLMNYSVIEFLDNFENIGVKILPDSAIQKANSLQLSEETIKTVTFAYLWAQNLCLAEQRFKTGVKRPVKCIFLTASASVIKLFSYVESRRKSHSEEFASDAVGLPCLTVEKLNNLICTSFPSLVPAVLQPGIFHNTIDFNASLTPSCPPLTATSLIKIIDEYCQSLTVSPISSSLVAPSAGSSVHFPLDEQSGMNGNTPAAPTHIPPVTTAAATRGSAATSYSRPVHLDTPNPILQHPSADIRSSLQQQPRHTSQSNVGSTDYSPASFTPPMLGTGFSDMAWSRTSQQQQATAAAINVSSAASQHTSLRSYNQAAAASPYTHAATIQGESRAAHLTDLFAGNGQRHPPKNVILQAPLVEQPKLTALPTPYEPPMHPQRDYTAERYRSELIGAISIVEELSNRLKLGSADGAFYADDCLHRAKAHIQRWSHLLALSSSNEFYSSRSGGDVL